jgi:hypothetical protein
MVQMTAASDTRSDLSEIIKAGLGHRVDDRIIDGLAEMQMRLQNEQGKLATLLMENKISRTEYIDGLRSVLKEAKLAGVRLLGPAGFKKVFGDFSVEQLMVPADCLSGSH